MSAKANKTATIHAFPVKGDKELANTAGAAQRIEILDAIDTAEDLRGTALVAALQMTARFGRTSEREVREHYTRCDSPAVYASYFNRGAKAMEIVGEKLAIQCIDQAVAAAKGGAGFTRALSALKSLIDGAKQAGKKSLNNRDGAVAVKTAVAFSAESTRAKVAKKAKTQDAATMAAAAMQCGKGAAEMAAFVTLASQNAHRMPAPDGRESAWNEALQVLALASEKFSVFKRK